MAGATDTASPAETASPAGTAAPSTNAVRYALDPAQSEARYEVGETFFQDNHFAIAIGRTKAVGGELLVNFEQPSASQVGDIVIDISQLTSDQSRRDNYIRNNALQSLQYPLATFKTTALNGLPASVKVGDTLNFSMSGDLIVRDTTLPVTWQVSLKVEQDRLVGSAQAEVLMSDYKIGPIQLAFLGTEDKVKLVFDFVAAPVK